MDVSFQHDDGFRENDLVIVDVAAVLNFPATGACQHQPCAQNRSGHDYRQKHF